MKRHKKLLNVGTNLGFHENRNSTWVCFECRTSQKNSPHSGECHYCQHCGQQMISLGIRAKIPRKKDHKGWNQLYQVYIENKQVPTQSAQLLKKNVS